MRFARFTSLILLVLFLSAGCNEGAKRVRTYQNAREHFVSGNDWFESGGYEKAIAEFNLAIEIDPEYPRFYWERSKAYEKMGNIVRAIYDMQKYIQLNPEDPGEAQRRLTALRDPREVKPETTKTAGTEKIPLKLGPPVEYIPAQTTPGVATAIAPPPPRKTDRNRSRSRASPLQLQRTGTPWLSATTPTATSPCVIRSTTPTTWPGH